MARITGKLIYAYPEVQITSKTTGNQIAKREFVIAVQSFDRDTGEPAIDEGNTPQLALTGDRCAQLNGIAPGTMVSVDFYLRGRRYRDAENHEKIITDINVTAVRPLGAAPMPTAAPAQAPVQAAPAATAAQPKSDDLPF